VAKLDWYIRAGLKLKHLQMLVALDDLRNQGKVAAFMNVTQPALSKAMADLQAGLGHQLFERTGRGLRPTPYGEGLVRHARRILQDLSEAGEELHGLATGTSRKSRVGALHASASWLVPKALALFKEASPKSSISVRESTMDVLLNGLRLGQLDLIVGTLPTRQMGQDLEETTLFDDATVLVTRPGHPLASARSKPSWSQLGLQPWVLPPHDSLLRQPLLVAFAAYGVEPPANFVESLSLNVTLNYLQSSSAIASMPESLARKYASVGALAILPVILPKLVRPVGMIWLRGHPLSDGDRLFIKCIEHAAHELAVPA
jgi:DNA-binding transcriptional LysR family regulator